MKLDTPCDRRLTHDSIDVTPFALIGVDRLVGVRLSDG